MQTNTLYFGLTPEIVFHVLKLSLIYFTCACAPALLALMVSWRQRNTMKCRWLFTCSVLVASYGLYAMSLMFTGDFGTPFDVIFEYFFSKLGVKTPLEHIDIKFLWRFMKHYFWIMPPLVTLIPTVLAIRYLMPRWNRIMSALAKPHS